MKFFRCKGCNKQTAVIEDGKYKCAFCGKVAEVTSELNTSSSTNLRPTSESPELKLNN